MAPTIAAVEALSILFQIFMSSPMKPIWHMAPTMVAVEALS